MEKSLGNRTG